MKRYLLLCIAIIVFSAGQVGAQDGYTERAKKYVDEYASLAIYEQRTNGIPAAVTLGQGILETEAGISELATEANNHFGIKCKNGWNGPTFTHTDDAPDECFKKYSCAAESYKDHSLHLKRNPRYAPLFKIKGTDYAGWAVCLRKCGYATNPVYAQKLIKIIEDFNLQQYTLFADDTTLKNNYTPGQVIGTNAVAAVTPKTSAVPDAPVEYQSAVKERGDSAVSTPTHYTHTVKEGETMAKIAQAESMELRKLMELNLLNPNEEPVTGTVLQLRYIARQKPAVKVGAIAAHTTNAIVAPDDKTAGQNGDYVTIDRTKPKPAAAATSTVTPVKPPVANSPRDTPPPPRIIIINESKRPVRPPDPPTEEEKAAAEKEKEFTDLKAELDKVVYADDSKLIAQNAPAPPAEKKPVAAPAPANGSGGKYYIVKKGETAFSIAKKNNITLEQLKQWNKLDDGNVKVGQTLQVKE